MKATLAILFLMAAGLTGVSAQEVTTVQVAPSDQVVYPDASQILNKTPAAPAKPLPPALPSAKPLVGAVPQPPKPEPVKPAGAKAAPAPATSPAPAKAPTAAQGWYLRWTLSGDEAGARAWATARGASRVSALGAGTWEVLAGPLGPQELTKAIEGQSGKTELVRR